MKNLRLTLDAAGIGTWDWDLVADQHLWAETTEALYGFEPGTFPGTTAAFLSRVHPDDLERVMRAGDHAREGHASFHIEFRVRRPDNGDVWLASTGRFIYDEEDRPAHAMGVVVDITSQKLIETERREIEARALEERAENEARL
jgi:PAS domain S-box-containing protein